MMSPVNTYFVYLRKGSRVPVIADAYLEDRRAKRFYFYRDAQKKHQTAFFQISEVAGIVNASEFQSHEVTAEEVEQAFQQMKKRVS